MEKVCVVTNLYKDPDLAITNELIKDLEEVGIKAYKATLPQDTTEHHYLDAAYLEEDTDCLIVLGGDGSLIGTLHEMAGKNIPLLGVNLGHLGYLAEMEVSDLKKAALRLKNNEYRIEDRMLLRGEIHLKSGEIKEEFALNELVIVRCTRTKLTNYKLYVKQKLLSNYMADGLIISTPTGSTAYNLSAGGPIIDPTASMCVITPICSQLPGLRSLVLSGDDEIMVEIDEGRNGEYVDTGVSFDGCPIIPVTAGDKVYVYKSDKTAKLVKMNDASFLDILREKMH